MLKTTMPYAVEFNGNLVHCRNGELNTLTDLSQIRGDCRVVTDFQDAISRKMTVEADSRYVDLVISRKLQESGEFDEPVTVICHWKRKRGKNTTDIFFTALRSKQYLHYQELAAEHGDHLVILPLQSLLFSTLRKYGKNQPVAVVLQHDRFADIIVGTAKNVWYANRAVAFDNSDEQLRELWETVWSDIITVGQEHHRQIKRIYTVDWIDSGPLPVWDDDGAPEIISLNRSSVLLEGQPREVSLPDLVQTTAAGLAVASRKDKFFFGARRLLPYFNVTMLVAALLMGMTAMWYQRQSERFTNEIEKMHRVVGEIQEKAPPQAQTVPYQETLAFIQTLWKSRALPTYAQVLQDVSAGENGLWKIENLDASYSDRRVDVKAFGTISAPFEAAHKRYRQLQRRLQKRGYVLVEQRFDTRINVSSFLVHFAKEVS